MRFNYIVIEREFASGGRDIGKLVANKLNIPCYGREILEKAAERENLSVEYVEELEEGSTGSFLYSLYKISSMVDGTMGGATAAEKLNSDEINIIRELALCGPTVFVGRSAAYALNDRNDVLKVFVHANHDFRIKRACEVYGLEEGSVKSILKKYDKRRSNYFKMNCGKDWNEIRNYDLILDSSVLGIEKAAEIIAECCK